MSSPKPIIEVEIGGKKRPVRYGWNATAAFGDETGLSLDALQNLDETTMTVTQLTALLWAGLWDGARKKGQKFDASVLDVGDWLDEGDPEVLEKALEHYMKSQGDDAKDGDEGKAKGTKKKK